MARYAQHVADLGHLDDDLIWRRIAEAAGLMPIDGGGNLITLAGRSARSEAS